MNPIQVEQKNYQMPPQDGFTVAAFSHRRRHRTIGAILRKGLRRSHSEQRRLVNATFLLAITSAIAVTGGLVLMAEPPTVSSGR
jgi:hypothetical protein